MLPHVETDFFDFLLSVKYKLQTHLFVQDEDNVVIGESADLAEYEKEYFPRMEILPARDDGNGYGSQRDLNHLYKFGIVGYIKRDSYQITEKDVKDIVAMGELARSLIFSFHDDKQAGDSPCKKFDYLEPYPVLDFDFEIFAEISTFFLGFHANTQTKDTQI